MLVKTKWTLKKLQSSHTKVYLLPPVNLYLHGSLSIHLRSPRFHILNFPLFEYEEKSKFFLYTNLSYLFLSKLFCFFVFPIHYVSVKCCEDWRIHVTHFSPCLCMLRQILEEFSPSIPVSIILNCGSKVEFL